MEISNIRRHCMRVDFQPGLPRHAAGFQGWYVCSGLQPSSATDWGHWGIHFPSFWGEAVNRSQLSYSLEIALSQRKPSSKVMSPPEDMCKGPFCSSPDWTTHSSSRAPRESTEAFFVFSTKFSSSPYQFPLPSLSDRYWFLSHSLIHFQPANLHLRIRLPENNLRQMILQGLLFPPQCFH